MRQCGSCQLCCRLLPIHDAIQVRTTGDMVVREAVLFHKDDGKRCHQQCSKGCAIYDRRPDACRHWTCQWLKGEDVGQRPDRAHMVVDTLPDYVDSVDDITRAFLSRPERDIGSARRPGPP